MTDVLQTIANAKAEIAPAPIQVTASPLPAQAGSAVASVLLLASALPALVAVLGTHDVAKTVTYIGSAEFAPALGVIVAAGVIAWRQLRTRWSHQEKVVAADAAPDNVAIVKS